MKFICPESQKRVSLKWGNIVSTLSSGEGSAVSPAAAWDSVSTFAVTGASGCCANTGRETVSAIMSQRATSRAAPDHAILTMNLNLIVAVSLLAPLKPRCHLNRGFHPVG